MKKQNSTENELVTVDDVIEQYKLLRGLHKAACIIAVVLMVCMAGFAVWGILFEPLRWVLIPFGIVLGICGAVLYIKIHGIFIKTGSAILDYFRAAGMSELDLLQKARELDIKIKE